MNYFNDSFEEIAVPQKPKGRKFSFGEDDIPKYNKELEEKKEKIPCRKIDLKPIKSASKKGHKFEKTNLDNPSPKVDYTSINQGSPVFGKTFPKPDKYSFHSEKNINNDKKMDDQMNSMLED
mmetsp:Transcript_3477/g.4080  ORF Transcript_3477/g.4080 Transcript_3477/m.4080 type:complete len:122 (-) Transcript_3477:197-562(-)